jgi:hypothetical protein
MTDLGDYVAPGARERRRCCRRASDEASLNDETPRYLLAKKLGAGSSLRCGASRVATAPIGPGWFVNPAPLSPDGDRQPLGAEERQP